MALAVSIIIPVWNGAQHIARAVASASQQSLSGIEIIAVDDGSTDATRSALFDLAREEPRLRVLTSDKNTGPAAARNAAMDLARGRWIAPLDADDIMSPARLETLVAIADSRDVDFLADNMIVFDDTTGRAQRLAFPAQWMDGRDLTLPELLRRDQPHCAPATEFGFAKPIMRRAFLVAEDLRYDEDLRLGEDFDLFARAILAGARFATHPAALYAAERRPSSLSIDEGGLDLLITATQRLRRTLTSVEAEASALLDERLNALTYAALLKRVKQRRIYEGLELLTAISKPYLAPRLAEATSRRLGAGRHHALQRRHRNA